MVSGGGLNQVEFHAGFADNSIFFDVYDNSVGGNGIHVWDGNNVRGARTATNAGTMTISRVGSTLSGYYQGDLIYSESDAAALTSISFVVQNNAGSGDPVSSTFDNFSLTAQPVP